MEAPADAVGVTLQATEANVRNVQEEFQQPQAAAAALGPEPVAAAATEPAKPALLASTATAAAEAETALTVAAAPCAKLVLVADSASMQGRSPKQEVRHVKIPDLAKAAKALKLPVEHLGEPCAFFGIYDGHQGQLCSEFAAKSFHMRLLKRLTVRAQGSEWTEERIAATLRDVFEELDVEFLSRYRTAPDGCAVVVALIIGTRAFIAWVGHARCVLARRDPASGLLSAAAQTHDHRPTLKEEAERIRHAGGEVVDYGVGFARVAHPGYEERVREILRAHAQGLGTIGKEPVALDVSRALGDREFKAVTGKALLIATPGTQSWQLNEEDEFLVLSCGGIPEVMSDSDIIAQLDLLQDKSRQEADVRSGCGALVQQAYARGSNRNLTTILIQLCWPKNVARKVARPQEAGQEAGGKASAVAASKRRRLEIAASVSAQKVAAYERAVSSGVVAVIEAADRARKEAEIAVMKAEVEATKVEVRRKEEENKKKEEKRRKEEEEVAEPSVKIPKGGDAADGQLVGLDAADAFFAARRKQKSQGVDLNKEEERSNNKATTGELVGLDAADAFFAARRKQKTEGMQQEDGAAQHKPGGQAKEEEAEASTGNLNSAIPSHERSQNTGGRPQQKQEARADAKNEQDTPEAAIDDTSELTFL